MAKIRDLSPRAAVKTAADELKYEVTPGELPMADNWGGMQVFSQSFKRGYGDDMFGVDVNGLWMGAAEFADAPFRVDFQGNVTAISATFGGYITKAGTSQDLSGSVRVGTGKVLIDGVNGRITFSDADNERGRLGNLS